MAKMLTKDEARRIATIKGRPDVKQKNSDPWADVRPAPPAAAKNKQ